MVKVLRAGVVDISNTGYVEQDFGVTYSDFWTTFGLAFHADALASWATNSSPPNGVFVSINDATSDFVAQVGIQPGTPPPWTGAITGSGTVPAPVAETWQLCEIHYNPDGTSDFYVDGILVFTGTGDSAAAAQSAFLGQPQSVASDPASVVFIRDPKFGTTRGGSDIFSDDFSSGDLSAWTSSAGDVSVVDDPFTPAPPPPPPGRRWTNGTRGRIIVTDLLGQVTTWLDHVHLGAQISLNLNQPSTITVALRPNNRAVNTIYTDGDPLVAQSNRLVYVFLREGGAQPWVCRAAGIAMSPEDQGDPDVPTTHLVAYDPWTYLAGRPFYSDTSGTLPGPDGFPFPATRGGVIIATALKNAIESEGIGCFVDAGVIYGGTIFWNGVIEDTPILDYKVQQGQTVADVWNGVIAAGDPSGGPGGADVLLTPIYDVGSDLSPTRPGFTHELSVFNLAGQIVPSSPMAWGEFTRVATVADRQHDGTPGAFINEAYYYAGQGGFPVGLVDNALSVAKYRPYRATQFFPQQLEGDVVQAFAQQAITLAKQGKRTFTVDPDPMRAPAPFTGYNLGDRIPQLAPKTLRVAATGYQRIQTIPLEINPDGVTRVRQLLTTPDWRGDDGT